MTPKLLDDEQQHELKEKIADAVHKLVNEMLMGVDDESDENIRQTLTEQFRFWKRARGKQK